MVYLEDSTHTYYNTELPNIQYKSVTTLLHSYKKEFNTLYHATRVAKREGVDVSVILDKWRLKNENANIFGTNLHLILENFILNQSYKPKDKFERVVIEDFTSTCLQHKILKPVAGIYDRYNRYKVHAEKVLNVDFNENFGIAGTSDIIEDVNDDYFNVYDFKTNETFSYESKYNDRLLAPLGHLDECEMNDYTLQLSLYAVMYEKQTKRKFKRGGLFYWDQTKNYFSFIPITYHRHEAIAIIMDYKQKLGL